MNVYAPHQLSLALKLIQRRWLNPLTAFVIWVIVAIFSSSFAQFNNPPKPEDAFKVSVFNVEPGRVQLHWQMLDHIYMYDDKFSATFDDTAVTVESLTTPDGEIIDDPLFGEVTIHWDNVFVDIVYTSDIGVNTTITVGGQGCHKEMGICYSPVSHNFTLSLPPSDAVAPSPSSNKRSQPDSTTGNNPRSLWVSLGLAFIGGLALSLTPCVLPMVPILAGIVMGGQPAKTPLSTRLTKGSTYILGTIASYALIGAFAGFTGTQLQAWLQSMWMTALLISILIVMAFSMFGLFTVTMPAPITKRLDNLGQGRSGLIGIFVLGMTTALMVGACVTPVLIGIIGGIISSGSPVYGALTMAMLALGMGVPLFAVCFGAAKWLPKSGPWMGVVSHILGWGLLGVATWLASNLLPINPLWPVAALMFAASLYCIRLSRHYSNLATGGLIALFSALTALYAVGAYQQNSELLRPIKKIAAIDELHYEPATINDIAALDTVLANNPGTTILVDFRADWCTDCIRFERTTLRDARVVKALETTPLFQIDITNPNSPEAQIQKKYGVYGPPAIMVFRGSPEPEVIYGYLDAQSLLNLIRG